MDLICCQRGRNFWRGAVQPAQARRALSSSRHHRASSSSGSSAATPEAEAAAPEAEQQQQLVVRVLSAELCQTSSFFGLGMDLFAVVLLEEGSTRQQLGRSPTLWMGDSSPSWHHECDIKPPSEAGKRGRLLIHVMRESLGGWGEAVCHATAVAGVQSLLDLAAVDENPIARRRHKLSLREDGGEFMGTIRVEVFLQKMQQGDSPNFSQSSSAVFKSSAPSAEAAAWKLRSATSDGMGSQGSTTPEVPLRNPRQVDSSSAASDSDEETQCPKTISTKMTVQVADAMLRHFKRSGSFALLQELAAKLQLECHQFQSNSWTPNSGGLMSPKSKTRPSCQGRSRFFTVIGQESLAGGADTQRMAQGGSCLGKSLELAWFETRQDWLNLKAPLGSVPLEQVQGCAAGAQGASAFSGPRYQSLDADLKAKLVIMCTLNSEGVGKLEVLCDSKEQASQWSFELQRLLLLVRETDSEAEAKEKMVRSSLSAKD